MKKEIIIAIVFLTIGWIIGPTTEIEKEVIKEVKVMEYSETCEAIQIENKLLKKKNGIQGQIMVLDDQIIHIGSQGLGYCSEMIGAISEYDYNKVDHLTNKTNLLTPKMLEAGNKKHELLKQLGNIK